MFAFNGLNILLFKFLQDTFVSMYQRARPDEAASPAPSLLSVKSDESMDRPIAFNHAVRSYMGEKYDNLQCQEVEDILCILYSKKLFINKISCLALHISCANVKLVLFFLLLSGLLESVMINHFI